MNEGFPTRVSVERTSRERVICLQNFLTIWCWRIQVMCGLTSKKILTNSSQHYFLNFLDMVITLHCSIWGLRYMIIAHLMFHCIL